MKKKVIPFFGQRNRDRMSSKDQRLHYQDLNMNQQTGDLGGALNSNERREMRTNEKEE